MHAGNFIALRWKSKLESCFESQKDFLRNEDFEAIKEVGEAVPPIEPTQPTQPEEVPISMERRSGPTCATCSTKRRTTTYTTS